jgi:hypothetical protein
MGIGRPTESSESAAKRIGSQYALLSWKTLSQ